MARPGHSTHFVVPGIFKPVNLNNENLSVEFIKSLYDKGIRNIILTEEGEAKFNPKKAEAAPVPKKKTKKP
jgi:hypothetical protein